MNDDFVSAVIALGDAIDRAIGKSVAGGLTDQDVIKELRRIADEIEAEGL